jgi:hypothetical protein
MFAVPLLPRPAPASARAIGLASGAPRIRHDIERVFLATTSNHDACDKPHSLRATPRLDLPRLTHQVRSMSRVVAYGSSHRPLGLEAGVLSPQGVSQGRRHATKPA